MSPRFCAMKECCIYFILFLVLLTGLFWWLEISMEERPLVHASSLPSPTQKDSFHLLGFCRDFRLFTPIQRPRAKKHRREKMRSVSFQVRVTPLNTIFPSSTHLVEIFMTSFFLHLNSASFGGHLVVSFSWLLGLRSLWLLLHKSLYGTVLSPLCIHHRAVQLGHMVGLFAALWGFSTLISSMAAQVFAPNKSE